MTKLMRMMTLFVVLAAVVLLSNVDVSAESSREPGSPLKMPQGMKKYVTRYYNLYTDKPVKEVPEVAARLRVMAELYYKRTKGFGGVIRSKLNFYMFTNKKDYYAAGGMAGSAGVYRGMTRGNEKTGELLAIANSDRDWETIQHEGFHQFVHMAIGGKIPIWVNEGLAEYFGDALWTGDSLRTGIIQPRRQKQIVKRIKAKSFVPLEKFLGITGEQWNAALSSAYYDQAWSLTHFLVHAENGKYKTIYAKFISDISRGRTWQSAWKAHFRVAPSVVEKKYREWWLALPEDAGEEAYRQATLETLVSFLARSWGLKLKFATADEFFAAAREGKLKLDMKKHGKGWLPESLLADALKKAKAYTWTLEGKAPRQKLILTDAAGVSMVGEYRISSNVVKVTCKVVEPKEKSAKDKAKSKK